MMRMCEKFMVALLTISLLSISVSAKTDLGNWNNVERLKTDSSILVETKRGEQFEGKLQSATGDSMSVRVRVSGSYTQVVEVRREDVSEVRRKLNPIIGGVIGAGIGIGISAALGAATNSREDGPLLGIAVAPLGILIGGGVGAKAFKKGKRIYVAP